MPSARPKIPSSRILDVRADVRAGTRATGLVRADPGPAAERSAGRRRHALTAGAEEASAACFPLRTTGCHSPFARPPPGRAALVPRSPKSSSHGHGLRWLKHRRKSRAWDQADEGNVQVRAWRGRPPSGLRLADSVTAGNRPTTTAPGLRADVELQRAVVPRYLACLRHAVEVIDGPAGPSTDMTPGTSHSFIPVVEGRRDVPLPAVRPWSRDFGMAAAPPGATSPNAAASGPKAAAQPALPMLTGDRASSPPPARGHVRTPQPGRHQPYRERPSKAAARAP